MTADEIRQFEKKFQALPIRFGPPNEQDYVVIGNGRLLTGGDNDWFWLVRMTSNGPTVVLWLRCLNFGFDRARTNGLMNVSSEWNSPSEEIDEYFHFNGRRYVRVSRREKSVNPGR